MTFPGYNMFSQRLEPFAVTLEDGKGHIARLAGLYVRCRTGFSGVSSTRDLTEITIVYCHIHRLLYIRHVLTSLELSPGKCIVISYFIPARSFLLLTPALDNRQ